MPLLEENMTSVIVQETKETPRAEEKRLGVFTGIKMTKPLTTIDIHLRLKQFSNQANVPSGSQGSPS